MKPLFLTIIIAWLNIAIIKVHASDYDYELHREIRQALSTYRLIITLAEVESNFDPSAYNPKEDAAGILQIRPVMFREVNRLLGREVYTDTCRFNVTKAVDMFLIIQRHYNPTMDIRTGAFLWNCGTTSPTGTQGQEYWKKVKRILNK